MDVRIPYEVHVRNMWTYWEPLASSLAGFLQTEKYWNNDAFREFYALPRIRFMAELEAYFIPIPSFLEAFRDELGGGIPADLDLRKMFQIDDLAMRVNRLMDDGRPMDAPGKSLELGRHIIRAESLICGDGPYRRMPEFRAAYEN